MTKTGLYEPLPADSYNAFSAFRGMSFLQFTGILWVVAICGGLVGLLISCLPRTQSVGSQTLAVTLLPIFLIPHLLFNRTVIGETGMRNFVQVSSVQGEVNQAYAPVRHASQNLGNPYAKLHHRFSITGYSRPAINVMYALNPPGATQSAQNHNRIAYKSWLYVEIVFLLMLMLAYACMLLLVFYYAGPARALATRMNEG